MRFTKSKALSKFSGPFLALAIACTLSGCSSGNNSSTTQPPPVVSVTLNQSTVSVVATRKMPFTASVTGTTNTAVTWSVDSVSGGNSTVGTITTGGLYTAPPLAGSHTVTATSVADTSKTASAAVTVTAVISVSPTPVSVVATQPQQFSATVLGFSNSTVTWSVDQISGGNSTVGTITAAGLYTAPSLTGSHTVTVTSAADTSQTASAAVTVTGAVSVSPSSVDVLATQTQQFNATVLGFSSTTVTWSVDQISGGNSTVGTINSSGLYTSPGTPGSHTITATSNASNLVSGSAQAAVFTLSLSPSAPAITTSSNEQFTATTQGLLSPVLNWSVDQISGGNSTVGTITATGLYTAPATVGNHTIAVSVASTPATAATSVTVFFLSISPTAATAAPSGTEQFSATVQGLTNATLTWSVDGVVGGNSTVGTVSASGRYTAPASLGQHTIAASPVAVPSASASATLTVINVSPGTVLTYHNDDARDGAYLEEVSLTPSNVNSTQFGKLLSYRVDGQIYAQPLYLSQVSINGGTHDVVYVTTQNNSVYAFDADATAQPTTFWQRNLGGPVTKDDDTGVNPVVGVLSTPVIDVTTNTMYVVAEVTGTQNNQPFQLHALDVTTGADKFGGPVTVIGSVPGTASDNVNGSITLGSDCYQRMGLVLDPVTNSIYIPFGSCNHGWILAYDKTSLKQTAIFSDTPDGDGGGLWASGGAPAIDDATGDIYLMSGVDATDIVSNGYNDSFLRLKATDLSVLDYFTPDDRTTLEQNDADLGAGSNVIVPGSTTNPNITVGGGKDGNIFVVNRDDMGGYNSGTNNVLQTVQTGSGVNPDNNIFSTPVYWNGSIYYHCNNDVLRAFTWTAGNPAGQQLSSTPTSKGSNVYGSHGATASLSANGATSGIIWDTDNSAYNGTNPTQSGPLVLHAYDATNVATELYNSSQAAAGRDTAGLALKFTVPTIANGRVFVPTASELDIYGLLP